MFHASIPLYNVSALKPVVRRSNLNTDIINFVNYIKSIHDPPIPCDYKNTAYVKTITNTAPNGHCSLCPWYLQLRLVCALVIYDYSRYELLMF